jgi:hypothetical protein
LSLGEERIKGERRLPRTARPRDDHELVARNLDIEVAQVMLPRPLDPNELRISHRSEKNSRKDAEAQRETSRRENGDNESWIFS